MSRGKVSLGLVAGGAGVELPVGEVADQPDQVGGLVGRQDTGCGHGRLLGDTKMILASRLQYRSEPHPEETAWPARSAPAASSTCSTGWWT